MGGVEGDRRTRPQPRQQLVGSRVKDAETSKALLAIEGAVRAVESRFDDVAASIAAVAFEVTEDLDFNGFAAVDLDSVEVEDLAAGPGVPRRIYMVGGEWFVTDGAGNQIQITSGGTLALDAHGTRQKQIPAVLNSTSSGATPANVAGGEGVASSGGASTFFVNGPEMRRGDRLLSCTLLVRKVGATGNVTVTLYRRNAGGGVVSIGTTTQSVTIGTDADIVVTPASSETVAARYSYVVQVAMPQSNDRAVTVTFDYDRP